MADKHSMRQLWEEWEQDGCLFWQEMDALVDMLDGLTSGETEKD
jgi:type I restriction enzyme M protein